jgi:DNA-binding MarR family transcriptional regulator
MWAADDEAELSGQGTALISRHSVVSLGHRNSSSRMKKPKSAIVKKPAAKAGPRGLKRSSDYPTGRFYTRQIALLSRLIARTTKPAFDRLFNISQMEWRILVQLEYRSPSKIAQMYQRSLMPKSQISSALPALIGKGYVVREDDPDDARAPYFAITAEGLALHKAVLRVSQRRQNGLESLLTKQERKIFADALDRLVEFYLAEDARNGDGLFGNGPG